MYDAIAVDNFNKMVIFLRILFSKVYILLTAIYLSDVTNSQICLFQEGQPYEVFVDFKIFNSITKLTWQPSAQSTATSCTVCSCDNYPSSPFKASVICSNNFIDNSTLVVVHKDRNFVQSFFPFKCVASGQVFSTSCQTALIYVSPTNNTCYPPVLSIDGKNVSVVCTTNKTYPEAKCIINSQNRNSTNITCTSTSYTISGNEYMTTSCNFVTEVGGLQLGTNVFSAYLYPYVINGTQFAVRANDVSIDLVLPVAVLMECRNDSMDYIKLGDTYSCECTNSTAGNIPAKFQWYDEKNVPLGTGVLTGLVNVSGVSSKVFKCLPQYTWTSTLSGTSIIFVAKFSYGPTNATIERKDVSRQNDTYNLCPTTGNITFACHVIKATVNPEPSITMYQNNLPLNFSTQHNSSRYNYISSFQPRSAGVLVFGCLVQNSKYREINVNTSLRVEVIAPPINKPILQITDTRFDINQVILEENKTYNVSCYVDGGVDVLINCGNFSSEPSRTEAKLSLPSVSRNLHSQNCTCTSEHITGCYTNNTTWFFLNVTYSATITTFTANNETSVLIIDDKSTMNLFCKADGNPVPKYSIKKESGHFVTTLQDEILTAKCSDSGVYTCFASNGIIPESRSSITVYVQCAQRLPQFDDNNQVFTAELNSNVTLKVNVLGYPPPVYYTLFKDQYKVINLSASLADEGNRYNISYVLDSLPYGHITISIYNITISDFANYTLNIYNGIHLGFNYSFQLNAENGKLSRNQSTDEDEMLPAVLGGVSGSLLLALIILLIVRVKCYTTNKSEKYMDNIRSTEQDTQNNDLYFIKLKDNSEMCLNYKSYSDISTTITSATAAPKNLKSKQKPVPKPTYFNTVESHTDDFMIQGQEKQNLIIKGHETKEAEVYTNDTDPEKKTNNVYANC